MIERNAYLVILGLSEAESPGPRGKHAMARYEFIAVYIMASQRNGTIYVGVTNDMIRRAYEYREGLIDGFTRKYGCKLLVWFEQYELMTDAIEREKRLKVYRRLRKLELIEKTNPQWRNLYDDFVNPPPPTFLNRLQI